MGSFPELLHLQPEILGIVHRAESGAMLMLEPDLADAIFRPGIGEIFWVIRVNNFRLHGTYVHRLLQNSANETLAGPMAGENHGG